MSGRLVVAGILAAGLCGSGFAGDEQGKAELVADVESIQPGTPFMAGVLITLPEHWHTYWLNSGDSGMPPELKWQLPEGFTAGPVLWPPPKRFDEPPVVSFGYDNQVLLIRKIDPPADLAVDRDYTIEVDASWLVCKEVCIPKTAKLQLTLRVRAESPAASKWRAAFASVREELPATDPAWTFRSLADKETILLCVIPPPGLEPGNLEKMEFFPAQPDLVEYGQQTWTKSKDEYCLSMKQISGGGSLPARLEGVLVVPKEKETKALAVNAALEK
jgi:DsbC/DsbD-like thiol-disulfide interchange protein